MVCAPLLAASHTVSVTGPPCVPQRARKPTVFDGRKPWRIHDGLHTLGSQNRQGAQAMSRRGAPHPPPVQHAPYRETCTRQPALVRHSEARVDPQPEHHGGGEVPDLRSRARPPRGMGPAAVPPLPPRPRRPPRGGGACRLAAPPSRAERTRSHGPAGGAPPCRGQILVHQAAPLGQEVRETPGDRSAGQAQDGGTLRHRERLRHLDADAHREDGALVRRQGRMRPHDAAPGHLLRNGRPRRTGARACAHQIGTGWHRCPGRSQYLRPDTRRPGTPPGTGNTGRCRPGSR